MRGIFIFYIDENNAHTYIYISINKKILKNKKGKKVKDKTEENKRKIALEKPKKNCAVTYYVHFPKNPWGSF